MFTKSIKFTVGTFILLATSAANVTFAQAVGSWVNNKCDTSTSTNCCGNGNVTETQNNGLLLKACDLGLGNNKDDGTAGCKTDCTVAAKSAPVITNAATVTVNDPGWNCTNTQAGYDAQKTAVASLFITLKQRQGATTQNNILTLNNCKTNSATLSTTDAAFCTQYAKDIVKFKDLNLIISVKDANPANLKSTPVTGGSPQDTDVCVPNNSATKTTFVSFNPVTGLFEDTAYSVNCGT